MQPWWKLIGCHLSGVFKNVPSWFHNIRQQVWFADWILEVKTLKPCSVPAVSWDQWMYKWYRFCSWVNNFSSISIEDKIKDGLRKLKINFSFMSSSWGLNFLPQCTIPAICACNLFGSNDCLYISKLGKLCPSDVGEQTNDVRKCFWNTPIALYALEIVRLHVIWSFL